MEVGLIFGTLGAVTAIWVALVMGVDCSNLVKHKKAKRLVNGLFMGTIVCLLLLIAFSAVAIVMHQCNFWYAPLYVGIICLPLLLAWRKKMLAEHEA